MTPAPLRLGTRASLLATTQSQHVADALTAATGRAVEIVRITSEGDILPGPLSQLGGTGVFASALREALVRDECDFLVHSMKDLPTAGFPGLVIGAVPVRAPHADVLCARDGLTLETLPQGARIGSGSPRRVAQLLRARPDLDVHGIRGNVDSRLKRVDDGDFDAIVLAQAGLHRIGREHRITDVLPWATSAAQGALAVEVRAGDHDVAEVVATINDADAELTSSLERDVLRKLEAGCAAPVAIDATVTDAASDVALSAEVFSLDGARTVTAQRTVSRADIADAAGRDALTSAIVAELLEGGAAELADLGGRR